MKNYLADMASKQVEFQIDTSTDHLVRAQFGDRLHEFNWIETAECEYSVIFNNQSYTLEFCQQGENWQAFLNGQEISFKLFDEKALRRRHAGSEFDQTSGQIKSPMPGKIVDIKVKIGQNVKIGEALITVEAMKMQNEFKSPIDGTVSALHVKMGDSVEGGQVIVEVA